MECDVGAPAIAEVTNYTFRLDLQVDDPQQLYDAALDRALVDGLDAEEAREILGSRDEPKVEDCLTMLLDPGRVGGCSIDGSGTERAA